VNMTRERVLAISIATAVLAFIVTLGITLGVRQRSSSPASTAPGASAPSSAASGASAARKIKAKLYYVSMDGTKLTGVDREVAYGEGMSAQAQEVVAAQLAPAAAPLVSAIPPGTKLRAVYVTEKGEAYVDLSKEVSSAHTGGSQDELLTIYSIVNALTSNLPAVMSVQLLVDGKEVNTLAGHIDLRKPLGKNLELVE
jgi:spore germination protein GerM